MFLSFLGVINISDHSKRERSVMFSGTSKLIKERKQVKSFWGIKSIILKFPIKPNLKHNIPDGENLAKVEIIIVDLSNEDGCKGFI